MIRFGTFHPRGRRVFLAGTVLWMFLLLSPSLFCASYSLKSPNGELVLMLEADGRTMSYGLSLGGRQLIAPSHLSILREATYDVVGESRRSVDGTWHPVWGQFSQIRDHFEELTLHLRSATMTVDLICRAYDDGIGLRFAFPEQEALTGTELELRTEFLFGADYPMYHPWGEGEPVGPIPVSSFQPFERGASIPAVIEVGESTVLAILESDLYTATSAAEIETMSYRAHETETGLVSVNALRPLQTHCLTPWRVVLVGRRMADLVINPVPLNLAARSRLDDVSWIAPGKSMWDWRVRGYQVGDFTYGTDTASIKRFVDFAAANNVRYFLLDWFWYQVQDGQFEVAPEIDIEEVMSYAAQKGVGIILYWDGKHGKRPRQEETFTTWKRWDERPDGELPLEKIFDLYRGFGAAGIKYGFRYNNAAFTAEAIRKAAEHHLLIDFHDRPVPMVGVRRTLPNAVTREYNHAQMDARRNSSPTAFLKMVTINAMTGPLDMNNGFYALNTDREKTGRIGWSRRSDVPSTVASETARTLVCFSGLIVLPDAPEEYEKKADIFEFIARMPQATWDETRILSARGFDSLSVARRSGKEWFVGSVSNEKGACLSLHLDFLEPGQDYDMTFYEDAPDAHYEHNKESYRVRKGSVRKDDLVQIVMAPGGGHSMWIRPKDGRK